MKRKAPSAQAMRKALATFKQKHPGQPVPGFLRKYAGVATISNPRTVRRVKPRKKLRSVHSFKAKPKLNRPSVKRVPRSYAARSREQSAPFIVEAGSGAKMIHVGAYHSLAVATKLAKAFGRGGLRARVARRAR